MGETSSGQLAFIKETVAGTTPATPAFSVMDFTSEDLVLNASNVRSQAVTPQRVVKGSRRTGREAGGGINLELYKGAEIDALLAALCGNSFTGSPLTSKAGGSTVDTFTFERKLKSNDFRRFTGVRIGQADFSISPEAIIGVRLQCLGYSMVTAATAISGSTYSAATAAEKLTALDVASIALSGGISASYDFATLNFSVNNQLASSKRIGPNSTRGIRAGQALITGNMSVFCEDKSLADAYLAETKFNMDIPMLYSSAGYTALFKNVAILSYNDNNTGNNNDFMANIEFEATLDATFTSSFGISKTS